MRLISWLFAAAGAVLLFVPPSMSVNAATLNLTGNVDQLEMWFNGNVAFTLSTTRLADSASYNAEHPAAIASG